MTKLDSDFISLKINIDSSVKKDFNGNLLPLNPTLIFLSFIPFQNNIEANITNAQKLQRLSEDLDRKYKDIRFKIPLLRLQDSATFKEWEISMDKSQHK